MSGITVDTRVLQYRGELYLSVETLEAMVRQIRNKSGWEAEVRVIQQIIDGAREAQRLTMR